MFIGIVKMIFQMSLISSGVILIVLFFRWIIGKMKVAASFKCLLWAVVLFRLICPYTLTSSIAFIPEKLYSLEFSAGNGSESVSKSVSENNAENTLQNVSQAKVKNESQSGLQKVSEDKTDTDYSSSYIMPDSSPKQSFLETIANTDIWFWICVIWSLGFAGMIVWEIASYIRLKRKLVGSVRLKDNIYECDYISSAFVLGAVDPKIYISSGLNAKEKEYILLHEQTHIRRLDMITRLAAYFALCLHWFNPLCWMAFLVSETDMEMACDEKVMRDIEDTKRSEYATAIFNMALGRQYSFQTPLSFGKGNTKGRIVNIMNFKKNSIWMSMAALVLVGSLTVACGTNSVANNENDSSEATNTKVNTQDSQTESVNEEANVDTTETAKDEVAKENDNAVGDEADIIYNENGLLGAISNGDWTISVEQYEEDLKAITGGLFGEAEGDDYEVTLTVVDKDKKEILSSKILSVDKNIENKKMAENFLYEHNGKKYFATYCLAYNEELSAGYCVGHVENKKIIWDAIIYDPGNADGTTVYDCTEAGSISDYSKKGKVLYETKTAGKVDEKAYLKAINDKLKNVGIDLEEAQFTNYSHKYYKMKLQNTNPSVNLDI